jgi:uncharacterized RDD family membrane protein YckC
MENSSVPTADRTSAIAPGPGYGRRMASLAYELMLLAAIAFVSSSVFTFASGAARMQGWVLHLHQAYLIAVFAAYFVWCWSRSGQTLAMKAWRLRLVDAGGRRATPGAALIRFLMISLSAAGIAAALILARSDPGSIWIAVLAVVGALSPAWSLFDPERQFLHDRLSGTRIVTVP